MIILEGWSFDFEQVTTILTMYGIKNLSEKFTLIGLVQNHKTVDERVNDMKKYDTEYDWTRVCDNLIECLTVLGFMFMPIYKLAPTATSRPRK
ncbi:MAG: hypothetical protein FWC16_13485 [Defluviitaleaceae bacterium]|nr:hypothetical protein [Defluviitaleaceae bacterium]MCL2275933.1 hypothetical protein [Defluviitaleaceae bacterium]